LQGDVSWSPEFDMSALELDLVWPGHGIGDHPLAGMRAINRQCARPTTVGLPLSLTVHCRLQLNNYNPR